MSSYHAILVSRFFLGFTEATYYPGVTFILSRWYVADCLAISLFRLRFSRYKRDELGVRMAYLGSVSAHFRDPSLHPEYLLQWMENLVIQAGGEQ